jgi:hypothetical protein
MTLVVTADSPWVHAAGTIAEILDYLSDQHIGKEQVISWVDDGTNAKVVLHRGV